MGKINTESSEKSEILTGAMRPLIIKMSLPIFMGLFMQIVSQTTNTIWISQIDKSDPGIFGGVGLVIPIILLITAFSTGIMVGVSSLVARFIGEDKEELLLAVIMNGFLMVGAGTILILTVGYSYSEELVKAMGAEGSFFTNGHIYFRGTLPVIPLFMVTSVINGFLQGQGKMKHVMISMLLGTVGNIFLDYLFINHLNMGVYGATVALIIAYSFSFFYSLSIFAAHKRVIRDLFSFHRTHHHLKEIMMMIRILMVGLPQSLGQVLWALSILIINKIVMGIDPLAMTAFSLAGRIDYMVFMPVFALGTALVTIVGQNRGRGDYKRVHEAWRKTLALSFGVTTAGALLVWVGAPFIYPIMSDVEAVVDYAVLQSRVIILTYILAGVGVISRCTFQGLGNALPAFVITALRLFLFTVPGALIFTRVFNWGMMGVLLAFVVGNVLSALCAFIWTELVIRSKLTRSGSVEEKTLPESLEADNNNEFKPDFAG